MLVVTFTVYERCLVHCAERAGRVQLPLFSVAPANAFRFASYSVSSVNGTASALNATVFGLRVTVVESDDPDFRDVPDSFLSGYCQDDDIVGVTVADLNADSDVVGQQEHDIQGERLFEVASVSAASRQRNFSLHLLSVPVSDVSVTCEVVLGDTTFNSTVTTAAPATSTSMAPGGSSGVLGEAQRVDFKWNTGSRFLATSESVLDTSLSFTLTAVADGVDNGASNERFCVGCLFSSADSNYDGMYREFVCGVVVDADVAGLVFSPRTLVTAEADASTDTTHEVDVALQSTPVDDVWVTASLTPVDTRVEFVAAPGGSANISADGRTAWLSFSPATAAVAQGLLIRALDDNVAQASAAEFTMVLSTSSAGDAVYRSLTSASIEGTIIDDDAVGLGVRLVGGTNGQTTSENPTATALVRSPSVWVQLMSEPAGDSTVVVSAVASDVTEGRVGDDAGGVAMFTFTAATWNVSQFANVTGVDDDWIDGDQEYQVVLTVTASGDSQYYGLEASSTTLTNIDDDVAALVGPQTLASTCVTQEANVTGVVKVPVYLASSPSDGVFLNEALQDAITSVNGPGVYNEPTAFVDGDHSPNEWTVSPTADLNSCTDGSRYVTVDLGSVQLLTSLVVWHYYADVRQYCSQKLLLSVTGEFAGEEISVYDTGTGYGPVETAEGHLHMFNATSARYVRHHCGRSTQNTGIHFMELDVYGFSDVTVSAVSSDTTEGLVGVWPSDGGGVDSVMFGESADVVFSALDWAVPQYIAVRGVNDVVADGSQDFGVTFSTSSPGDPNFGTGTPSYPTSPTPVQAVLGCVNEDDDVAGVRVVPQTSAPYLTTEAEDDVRHTVSINVSLSSQPTATVVVAVASNTTSEGVVSMPAGGLLYFDQATWNESQVADVTGVDDDATDGPRDYVVTVGVAASGDAVYEDLVDSPDVVQLRNLDDDGVAVFAAITDTTHVPAPTTESGAGSPHTLNVRLSSEPIANVIVDMAVTNAAEGVLSASSVLLTPVTWAAGVDVIVRGVDDYRQDGSVDYAVVFNVTSADVEYNNFTVEPVRLLNLDDDVAAVAVAHSSDQTFESGQHNVSITIQLMAQPNATVEVTAVVSDATEAVLGGVSSVSFDALDWNLSKAIILHGVDDDVADGDSAFNVTFSSTSSSDVVYAALAPRVESFVNIDDDVAGVAAARRSLSCFAVTSDGGSCGLRVVLQSQPLAPVTVTVTSENPSAAMLHAEDDDSALFAAANLTFTADDWNTPQLLQLAGVDDGVAAAGGAVDAFVVFTTDTASQDSPYNDLEPVRLAFVNNDDAVYFVAVNVTGVSNHSGGSLSAPRTTESGGSFSGTVFVTAAPVAWVLVRAVVSDTGEARVSPSTFNLSAVDGSWAAPGLPFVVTGKNDNLDDGNRAYSVKFTVIAAAADDEADWFEDSVSDGVNRTIATIEAVNEDDDESALMLDVSTTVAVDESGTSREVALWLTSQPYTLVLVTATTSDVGEVRFGTSGSGGRSASVQFSPAVWRRSAGQTLTISGVADGRVDGDQEVTISLEAIEVGVVNAPSSFAGQSAAFHVVNSDEDEPGASMRLAGGALAAVAEESGPSSFDVEVQLSSQPLGTATITAVSTDVTAAVVTPAAGVVVQPADWATPAVFTVTGVDDDFDDGDQVFSVDFTLSCPDDPLFDGFAIPSLANAVTIDDDVTGVGVRAPLRVTSESGPSSVVAYVGVVQSTVDALAALDALFNCVQPWLGPPDVFVSRHRIQHVCMNVRTHNMVVTHCLRVALCTLQIRPTAVTADRC